MTEYSTDFCSGFFLIQSEHMFENQLCIHYLMAVDNEAINIKILINSNLSVGINPYSFDCFSIGNFCIYKVYKINLDEKHPNY